MSDRFGMLRIQCRIKAMTKSSRNRLDRSAKLYEKDTDEESDEDGQFPGQESTLYTSRATRIIYRRGPRRTTQNVTRIRSRKYPKLSTVLDIDSDDSEVDMGKLTGRRAASSQSDAA